MIGRRPMVVQTYLHRIVEHRQSKGRGVNSQRTADADPALIDRLSQGRARTSTSVAERELLELVTNVQSGPRPVRRVREYEVIATIDHWDIPESRPFAWNEDEGTVPSTLPEAIRSEYERRRRLCLGSQGLRLLETPVHKRLWKGSQGVFRRHDQRRQDAGEKGTRDDFPAYGSPDFLKPEYYQLRGKLDVPTERFIVFTEVPGRASVETRYGWAGWTAQQRVKAILAIDEELEDSSVLLGDRIGLLDSAWSLLPDVAREDAAAATRLKVELQALVGLEGPSAALIEDWKERFPPPTTRVARAKKAAAARDDDQRDTEESDQS